MKGLTLFSLILFVSSPLLIRGSNVVELTDENFDSLISEGTWMIEVFAPWCSHCRKVRPIWEELAATLKPEDIRVGSINGDKETILASRFETTGFPSFYHLKDGQCREYNGQRTVQKFAEFAKHGYAEVIPMPFYRAPNGSISRLTAQVKRFPTTVLDTYKWLHYDKQFSELSILAITLCIPVTVGFFMICVLDYAHIRSQRPHAD